MYFVLDSAAGITTQANPESPAAGTGSITSGPEGAAGHTVGAGAADEVDQFSGSEARCSTE